MNVRRRGFTLIEILITIGIILLLVGIAVYGIGKVGDAAKGRAVGATLGNLKGMIAELDATAGLTGRQPSKWYVGNAAQASTSFAAGASIWKDGDPTTATVPVERALAPAGSLAKESSGAGSGNLPPRYNSDAVANTQLVMGLLLAVPKNKTTFQQLPPEQMMEAIPAGVTTTKLTISTDRRPVPALPLDPWGNPVIFVPGSGLTVAQPFDSSRSYPAGSYVSSGSQIYRAKTGIAGAGENAPPGDAWEQVTAAPKTVSPDGRPFWASAGPDGDFQAADDNVYSFEN